MYVRRVQNVYSNIHNYIIKTSLEYNSRLSTKFNCNIFLKREDQPLLYTFNRLNKFLIFSNIICALQKIKILK